MFTWFAADQRLCHLFTMTKSATDKLQPYRSSIAGTLLAAREAVMAPLRPELRAANVTDQQWRVLRVTLDCDEIDAASIAKAAMLHPPSVTRILKELKERGLIDRSADARDGRRSVIVITSAGRALVRETASHTLEVLDHISQSFGEERLARLQAELAAFTQSIAALAPSE